MAAIEVDGIVKRYGALAAVDGMNPVMRFSNTSRALLDLRVVLIGSVVVFMLAVRLFQWRDQ